jgi:hypothetical protein
MDNQRKMVKLDQYYNIFTWLKMVIQKALPIFSNCHRQVLTVFLPLEKNTWGGRLSTVDLLIKAPCVKR